MGQILSLARLPLFFLFFFFFYQNFLDYLLEDPSPPTMAQKPLRWFMFGLAQSLCFSITLFKFSMKTFMNFWSSSPFPFLGTTCPFLFSWEYYYSYHTWWNRGIVCSSPGSLRVIFISFRTLAKVVKYFSYIYWSFAHLSCFYKFLSKLFSHLLVGWLVQWRSLIFCSYIFCTLVLCCMNSL